MDISIKERSVCVRTLAQVLLLVDESSCHDML